VAGRLEALARMLSGRAEHITRDLFAATEHSGETGNASVERVSVHEAIDAQFAIAANRYGGEGDVASPHRSESAGHCSGD